MTVTELQQAIKVWCSTYPRRVTSNQSWAGSHSDVEKKIRNIYDKDTSPFVSVYGFPDGHSKEKNIPAIDTLFIDFDIPKGGEYRSSNPDPQSWYRDMSGLLTRVRKVARVLVKEGSADNFRAALSGHKGVHLYLDFSTIDRNEGTIGQYKAGVRRYADELIEFIESFTGLDLQTWVDVDSSDMGRLCRLPNTKHWGASEAFDEDRYCVPVSIRELAEITPTEYTRLTRRPRYIPEGGGRNPSTKAAAIITQYIREAEANKQRGSDSADFDPAAITEYEKNQNEKITLEDIPFLTSNKPCIWAFRERDDMFNHGDPSHQMELNVIAALARKRVPIEVMLEYFSSSDDFNETETRRQINKVIGRTYSEFRCDTIWKKADEFCLGNECKIYQEEFAKQPETV